MTFINELIPEKEKAGFDFPAYVASDGSKPTLWKWTADKERDAYLVNTDVKGGAYDGNPELRRFVLLFEKHAVFFWAEPKTFKAKLVFPTGRAGNPPTPASTDLLWSVRDLEIPPDLLPLKREILKIIEEALIARGYVYDPERFGTISVTFE